MTGEQDSSAVNNPYGFAADVPLIRALVATLHHKLTHAGLQYAFFPRIYFCQVAGNIRGTGVMRWTKIGQIAAIPSHPQLL